MQTIPFNRPFVPERTHDHLRDVLAAGHFSGDGPYTKKCNALIEGLLGVPKVLLTTSCTHALEMTALLLDLGPGDDVIVPSFTFVSTVNAYVLRGAEPVFADIRADTLNLDERHLAALIGPRTRLIVPVHYAGVGCNMRSILAQARHHGVPIVEDNAHGLFGRYRGRPLGTLGCLSTLSFHETKNFSLRRRRRAVVINDPAHVERGQHALPQGHEPPPVLPRPGRQVLVGRRGFELPARPTSSPPLLLAQLRARATRSRRVARRSGIPTPNTWPTGRPSRGCGSPSSPTTASRRTTCSTSWPPRSSAGKRSIAHLRSRGVSSVFHYLPLHLSDMGRQLGGREGDCPVTEAFQRPLAPPAVLLHLTEDGPAPRRRGRPVVPLGRPAGPEDRPANVALSQGGVREFDLERGSRSCSGLSSWGFPSPTAPARGEGHEPRTLAGASRLEIPVPLHTPEPRSKDERRKPPPSSSVVLVRLFGAEATHEGVSTESGVELR